jgi:hypothetical protein
MKTRMWILIGALFTLPAPAWTVEPESQSQTKPADVPALQLQTPQVQKIIRAAAQAHAAIGKAAPTTDPEIDSPWLVSGKPTAIPFRAPRRPHHVECDSFNCVAYTADEVALFSIPRAQFYGDQEGGDKTGDAWLSCQSRNNLLTTFQRYDKCRGITFALPPTLSGDTLVFAPSLSF